MTPDQRKKVIIVAILVIAFGVVAYMQFGPDPAIEEMRRKQKEGMNKLAKAGTGTSAVSGGVSSLEELDFDLNELLASVKSIEFDYAVSRFSDNPMTPKTGYMLAEDSGELVPISVQKVLARERITKVLSKVITGIIWDSHNPLAVVDGAVLAQGDTLPDDVIVDTIEQNRVVFRIGDTPITVEMKEQ